MHLGKYVWIKLNHCSSTEERRRWSQTSRTCLGQLRTQLLLQALRRNIGTISVAKCGHWLFTYDCQKDTVRSSALYISPRGFKLSISFLFSHDVLVAVICDQTCFELRVGWYITRYRWPCRLPKVWNCHGAPGWSNRPPPPPPSLGTAGALNDKLLHIVSAVLLLFVCNLAEK